MINTGASGAPRASGVAHVARVGFIGQLPAAGVSTTNKSNILNLTSGSLPKGFIINQSPNASTNMNTGSTTIHNMVNVSGSVASFASQSPQTAKLPVNVNTNNMTGMTRHSVVTTTPFLHQNVSNISNICHPSSQRTTLHQNANINLQSSQPQQQLLQTSATTASTATASPLRLTILSSPASTPIKQQQLPASGVSTTNKSGILNLTSGSLPKGFIINQSPNASTKMINIGASGAPTAAGMAHVARVGFIGQLPTSGVSTTNKSNILNLTSGSLPKGFIINQSPNASTNINTGSTTIHNMVNVSGSVASFAAQSPQTKKLPVNVNTNNMTGMTRHSVVTTTPYLHQNVSIISNISNICHPSSQRTTLHQNANINLQSSQPQQQLLQLNTTSATTASTATASPLRPTILSSPASSPIKQQQLQPSTPSSPRPSILIRKRIANDSQSSVTPTNLFKTLTAISAPTTPQSLSNEAMSQQSCDNKSNDNYSTNDATNGVGIQSNCVTAPSTPTSDTNQTPRKKPRKQLLEPFTLKSSQNIQLLNNMSDTKLNEDNCNEKESLTQLNKKPRFSLLSTYNMQWKSLQYHFLRYSDVRPKPEKKLTLSDLSNEGLKKKNGWKIHHLATQMEVMSENEANGYQRLTQFLETFEKNISEMTPLKCTQSSFIPAINIAVCHLKSTSSDALSGSGSASDSNFDINTIAIKLNDLIRGNLQRSNLFSDQINEAKQLVIKLTNDHKERVGKITKKCANKRTYITK